LEFRFNAKEWAELTPAERVRRCRAMAQEASELSATASEQLRQTYLDLAQQWTQLALEIDKEAARNS